MFKSLYTNSFVNLSIFTVISEQQLNNELFEKNNIN